MNDVESPSSHPDATSLVALAESRLEGEDAERLLAHLERCASCREMVDDLRAFGTLEAPGPAWAVRPRELESTLADLRERLPEDDRTDPEANRRAGEEDASRSRPLRLLWAAVLALALGLIPLLSSRQDLIRRVQDLEAQLAAFESTNIVVLKDLSSSTRSSVRCLDPDRDEFWAPNWSAPAAGRYQIQIRGTQLPNPAEVVELAPGDRFAIRFPARSFSAGEYSAEVRQLDPSRLEPTRHPFCFQKEPGG